MVFALYAPSPVRRKLSLAGRAGAAISLLLLAGATLGWNAYGTLNQPNAAILVQNANISPAPTDLVPQEETSPTAAGTVVLTRRSFLGWQHVTVNDNLSGWLRRNTVMPLYDYQTIR
jgi:hypothetical protein